MKIAGYVLTGLKTYRQGAHSPHILDFSFTNDWFGFDQREAGFQNYEHLTIWPATRYAMNRLILAQLKEHRETFCIDDFAVGYVSGDTNQPILCTESEHIVTKSLDAVSRQCAGPVRVLKAHLTHWRHAMENVLLLIIIVLCAGCEIVVQATHPVPENLRASAFLYDDGATDQKADTFIIDRDASPIYGRSFIWEHKAPSP